MKKIVMLGILFLVIGVFGFPKTLRIAVVDYQEIFTNYSETKKVNDRLVARKKDRQEKLDKIQDELKKEEESYIKDEKKLSDKEKEKRKAAFQSKLKVLREKLARYQSDLRTLQKKLLGGLDVKIKDAIKIVGKKERVDMILEKNTVYYGGKDITEKVIEYLNK